MRRVKENEGVDNRDKGFWKGE